jgi:DNA-binding response OmpR family regulator
LKRGLEEKGHAVDMVTDGEPAKRMARQNPYDVVVLGDILPRLSGFEVCGRRRRAGRWSPILITACMGLHGRVHGRDADDYLVKPSSFAELTARLHALTRRSQPQRPPVLGVGDLRLDPGRRRERCGGTELSLSAKQSGRLQLFRRNAGVGVQTVRGARYRLAPSE